MLTMLRLKNIKIGSNFAEADFYPEDCPTCGHVVINLPSGTIRDYSEVSGYGASYIAHARQNLVRIAKEQNQQNECLIMWY